MKIVICDDNQADATLLHKFLLKYGEESKYDFDIIKFENGETMLNDFDKNQHRILFLDIYMNKINGVEVAKEIRNFDEDCKIIFTTISDSHKGEGFDVHATHYLVKPITYEKVLECMKRCKDLFNNEIKYLQVMVNRQNLSIPLNVIYFIEAVRNGVIICHKGGKVKAYEPITEIANKLNDKCFIGCHRGFIVNLAHVKNILEDSFLMINGDYIPIRQTKRAEVKKQYNDYFLDSLWQR